MKIVALLEEVGYLTHFFFAVRHEWNIDRLAQQLKQENELIGELWGLLEPVIAARGMEILEIEYRRESMGWVLRIFLDSEPGISVEDCAEISRIAGDLLDVSDLIRNAYHLEISSPGIDRPLRKLEHFQKYIGDIIEVRTISPVLDRRNFKGELKEASREAVTIECDSRIYPIPMSLIERARLLYFESMGRKSH
ncbi:Ribosome maturation factor RimP (modular protein) [Syntrophobacter sp. SbD1]|nr:Ribosome maturation factor RimP (modular protein) [Syntrophobacter sp. SbD1]